MLFTPDGLLFTERMSAPSKSSQQEIWQPLLLALLAVLIVVQSPLRESLWLDEAVSYWVIKDGFAEAVHRSFHYQGMSPLYFAMLWGVQQILGADEWALRLLSLAATAAACGLLYALARTRFSREAAFLAVAFFLCQDATQKLALSARPYALAVLCTIWSIYALVRWLQNGSRSAQLQYVAASVLTVYFHYLYAPLVVVHLAIVVLWKPFDAAKTRRLIFVLLPSCAVLLIPALFQVAELAQKSSSLKFMTERGVVDLIEAILPLNILVYLFIALAFSIVYDKFRWRAFESQEKGFSAAIAVWAVWPALWLFAYSSLSAGSVFVDRFYAWAAPAAALLLAAAVSHIEPTRARRNIFLVFMLMAFFREVQHEWNIEDWKGAVEKVNSAASPQVPVLAYSGLIEAEQLAWYGDAEKAGFLAAPFSKYALQGEVHLIPGSFERPEAAHYVRGLLESQERKTLRFNVIALRRKHEIQPGVWRLSDQYMKEYFEKLGFSAKLLEEKNLVRVMQFERSGLEAHAAH